MKQKITYLLALLLSQVVLFAQGFPDEMEYDESTHTLTTGGNTTSGFYEEDELETISLQFDQANYWTQLENNYASGTEIEADLTYRGDLYEGVGVRFKGNTSYTMLGNSEKKSWNITLDYLTPGQDVKGYETLNLNNAFQDASFIREVFFLNAIRNHIPAAKGNYVKLEVNGEDWGIYPNVQQLNAEFIREWFLNNDGTRWRAISPDGVGGGGPGGGGPGGGGPGGGGPGGGWGDGTAALNYLGSTQADYEDYYTLKSSTVSDPWQDLINTCDALNNGSLNSLESDLAAYMDIDRALWFLAAEILFTDDDGYVYKGEMDYLLYYDVETSRMTTLEFDGNSVMDPNKYNWSPFYNETNANYPLMNRLFAVPGLRQRYLAHMRTLIEQTFEPTIAHAKIDEYAAFIDAEVSADPKKIYTYNQYLSEVTELKDFVTDRYNYLMGLTDFAPASPTITEAKFTVDGTDWQNPDKNQDVTVTADVSHASGINAVWLYHATGIMGNFDKLLMFDDGAHGDGAANDGVYGQTIPAQNSATTVRFYIEAVANNTVNTVSYSPVGAEHDVYVYQVKSELAGEQDVVINEILAKNDSGAQDEAGEYDDWIELYNTSNTTVSLDGWQITDNQFNVTKYSIPVGTSIGPDEYLIIWADEDGSQGQLHANFKLSGDGESVLLFNDNFELVDEVTFGIQEDDIAYARRPNGTGAFEKLSPTFASNNDFASGIEGADIQNVSIYPNPTSGMVTILTDKIGTQDLLIVDAVGRITLQQPIDSRITLDVNDYPNGIYFVRIGNKVERLSISK